MLYDRRWEKPRKQRNWFSRWLRPVTPVEVFEITDFVSWVGARPVTRHYDFTRPMNCALAQYLRARGVGEREILMVNYMDLHPAMSALNTGGPRSDYTFDALRARLMVA